MIEITKKDLETKYRTMKSSDLAKELNVSVATLSATLKANGIPLKKPNERFYGKKKLRVI